MMSIPHWQESAVFAPFRAFVAEIDAALRSMAPPSQSPLSSFGSNGWAMQPSDHVGAADPRTTGEAFVVPTLPDQAPTVASAWRQFSDAAVDLGAPLEDRRAVSDSGAAAGPWLQGPLASAGNEPSTVATRAEHLARAEDAAREVSDRLLRQLRVYGARWQMSAYAEIGEARQELLYLFAALADDLLLNTEWLGKSAWIGYLLEARQFGSHVAGDAVFESIERLVCSQRRAKPMLARVYLLMLGVGYSGRYHGQPLQRDAVDAYRQTEREPEPSETSASAQRLTPNGLSGQEQLTRYRRQLYEAVMQQPLPEGSAAPSVVDPHAYAHTLNAIRPTSFRRPARWAVIALLCAGALLVLSQFAWFASSWPVRKALRETMQPSAQTFERSADEYESRVPRIAVRRQ